MGRETYKGNETKWKTKKKTFRYAQAGIQTQVVVICGPTYLWSKTSFIKHPLNFINTANTDKHPLNFINTVNTEI